MREKKRGGKESMGLKNCFFLGCCYMGVKMMQIKKRKKSRQKIGGGSQ